MRVDRDAWSHVLFTKTGSTATLHVANESYVKFGKTGYGAGEISKTGNDLPFKVTATINELTGSNVNSQKINSLLRQTTDVGYSPAQTAAATLPSSLGTTAATNTVLIGLSALRDLINDTDATLKSHGRVFKHTYGAPNGGGIIPMNVGQHTNTTTATNGNGHAGMDQGVTYYLEHCYLSNVAVFNKALTDAEVSELWTSRGVW